MMHIPYILIIIDLSLMIAIVSFELRYLQKLQKRHKTAIDEWRNNCSIALAGWKQADIVNARHKKLYLIARITLQNSGYSDKQIERMEEEVIDKMEASERALN